MYSQKLFSIFGHIKNFTAQLHGLTETDVFDVLDWHIIRLSLISDKINTMIGFVCNQR